VIIIAVLIQDIPFNDPLQLPPIPFPQFKERLLELHSSLAELPSLDPSEETNQLFAALVTLVSTSYANTAALARECALDSEIQGIQPDLIRICAEADGKQELWWARKISSGSSADSRYLFPYYQNYIQLTRLEYHVLVGLGADPRHVGFVGSGPLPLSSSILAADYILPRWNCLESSSPSYSSRSPSLSKQDLLQNSSLDPSVPTWKVTNVDILPDANAAAQAFCTTAFPLLISSGNCHFLTSSALDLPPPLLASFDTIYIAGQCSCLFKYEPAKI
jgi:hypothetical protein